MDKAHTHGLSLYICCMLIYLKVNVKYRCLYALVAFKWHDMREVETLIESTCMWYVIPCILCVQNLKEMKISRHRPYIYHVQFNE